MKVTVKLYSLIRHLAGTDTVKVEVPDDARVSDVLVAIAETSAGFKRAIDVLSGEILVLDETGKRLNPEDRPTRTIHVMPPPEGGSPIIDVGVLERGESLSLDRLQARIPADANVGAVIVFVGRVRRVNRGKDVDELVYEHAGELTRKKLEEVTVEIAEKYNLAYAAAYHYVGRLKPGDTTMVIVVAGENRSSTMPALEELVERVKREVPIWKLEAYKDGSKSYIVGGRFIDDS